MQKCPCDSQKKYDECCGIFIDTNISPTTPEQLMRSRYTAYTQANVEYILQTMKAPASIDFNLEETRQWAKSLHWKKLEVLNTTLSPQATVEFKVYYNDGKQNYIMHEISEFKFEEGHWYYTDSLFHNTIREQITSGKIGRNDPCYCGSNKKYKKCCGK